MQFANVHWISHHGDLPHEHRQNYCRQSQLYFIHLRMIPQSDSFRITLQPVLSLRWFLHLFSALRRGLQVGRLQFWSRLWCWLTVSFWSRFISVSTFSLLWIMLFPCPCDSSREQNKAWRLVFLGKPWKLRSWILLNWHLPCWSQLRSSFALWKLLQHKLLICFRQPQLEVVFSNSMELILMENL